MSFGKLVLSDGTEYDVSSEGIIHGNTPLSTLLGDTDISSVGDDITDSISNLGSDISTAQSNINSLDGEVDSLDSRLDTVEGNLTNLDASDIPYDNTTSGMTADDVQSALDTLKSTIDNIQPTGDADDITYDNTTSGLTATNVQNALDELANGSGGTSDYPDLTNKPSINGVQLLGNKVIGLLSGNIQVGADKIGFNNTSSGLSSANVQTALVELATDVSNIPTSYDADDISYDNTSSGMVATNVQTAINEVVSNVYTKAEIDGKVTISSTDISEGSSLATGNLYIVYATS